MNKPMLSEELDKVLNDTNVVRLSPGKHHFDPGKFNIVIIEKGASLILANDSVIETMYHLSKNLRLS